MPRAPAAVLRAKVQKRLVKVSRPKSTWSKLKSRASNAFGRKAAMPSPTLPNEQQLRAGKYIDTNKAKQAAKTGRIAGPNATYGPDLRKQTKTYKARNWQEKAEALDVGERRRKQELSLARQRDYAKPLDVYKETEKRRTLEESGKKPSKKEQRAPHLLRNR